MVLFALESHKKKMYTYLEIEYTSKILAQGPFLFLYPGFVMNEGTDVINLVSGNNFK